MMGRWSVYMFAASAYDKLSLNLPTTRNLNMAIRPQIHRRKIHVEYNVVYNEDECYRYKVDDGTANKYTESWKSHLDISK
jgi:hypothetical protein